MKPRSRTAALLLLPILVLLCGASASPAAAKDANADEPQGWMTEVDTGFKTYLVAPLEKVLFFDFWSRRWIRTGVPEQISCPNKKCLCKINTADYWPDGNMPIVVRCPQCDTEIETGNSVPLVVLWLFGGAVFFTVRMRFINIRGFWHAIRVTKGDYDDPEDQGEVSHFQA